MSGLVGLKRAVRILHALIKGQDYQGRTGAPPLMARHRREQHGSQRGRYLPPSQSHDGILAAIENEYRYIVCVDVKITYYLDVTSSWCYWAEPAWAELKKRYADRVEFRWKIAQMPADAYPVSKAQAEWFYRRSGTMVGSPFMLNSGWFEPGRAIYDAPNLAAEAARHFGVMDDRVRLALAHAAEREGQQIGQWTVAVAVAAQAAQLDEGKLLAIAQSADVAARVKESAAEFHALKVTQRPTFLIENAIGDRAVFSGIVRLEPLAAALDALLDDQAGYDSWKAHIGDPPTH